MSRKRIQKAEPRLPRITPTNKKPLKATHGSSDRPLMIGEIALPVYVLEDQTRVISQRGLQTGLGMSKSGGPAGKSRLVVFLERISNQRDLDFSELIAKMENPILFTQPLSTKGLGYGYEVTVLVDICHAIIDAHESKPLPKIYNNVVDHCKILSRAFAKVGIIALVDEATGYQYDRARDALQEALKALMLSEQLRTWAKTFPDEFYKELFRVYGFSYSQLSSKRPMIVGRLTKDLVYERLPVDVLEELEQRNPRMPSGRRKHKHFQWLSEDYGVPALKDHFVALITLLKASPTNGKAQFQRLVQRSLPKIKDKMQPKLIDMPDD